MLSWATTRSTPCGGASPPHRPWRQFWRFSTTNSAAGVPPVWLEGPHELLPPLQRGSSFGRCSDPEHRRGHHGASRDQNGQRRRPALSAIDEIYRFHVSSWLKLEVSIDRASFHSCTRCKSHAGMNHYVLFPFKGGALALWVIFTFGFDLAFHAGLMGLPFALALVSWFFKYCFVLLDSIVTGAHEPPVLSVEMVNPLNEQRPLGQALLITGGVFLTLAVSHSAGIVSGWICGALLLALLPASIATLGLTSNIVRAAWPPELWSVVRGVGQRDYL